MVFAMRCESPIPTLDSVMRKYSYIECFFLILIIFVFQDLKYIYGRYINPLSEAERNMYVNGKLNDPDFISHWHGLRVTSPHPIFRSYF